MSSRLPRKATSHGPPSGWACRVELTAAGQAFLDNARAIVAQFDRAFETTRRTARGEEGQICVGLAPTSPFHPFVPRVIRAFREAYPAVSLRLEERLGLELLDLLRNEQIDAAFIRTPATDREGVVIDRLLEEPMLIALPSQHPLARRRGNGGLQLKQLAREPFIFYRPLGTGLNEVMTMACRAAGFSPRIGQEAPRVTSALSLVAVGLGVSLVPASLRHVNMNGVVYRAIAGAVRPKATVDLASRRGDPSPIVQRFVNLVRQAAKDVRDLDSQRARPGAR
jgi:DNA-binding transcriptional LysR family regulator